MINLCYVYILKCKDDTFYTGWTVNLDKRIQTHNAGKASKYTRARLPVQLIYFETFENKIFAQKREYEIKQLSRPQKISLIESISIV